MSTVSYLTRIEFGEGQISRLPELLAILGIKNPLIATDKGLVGLTRGWRSLRAVVKDGGDVQARSDMMVCALEGAMAFQKGLGAVHAITHPVGAVRSLNLHHGTLNAVLMPAVLRFNRSFIGEKWHHLQTFFGQAPDIAIAELNCTIGMPTGLRAMGVTDEMMETVSHEALKDHCHVTNPRLASQSDYLAIMQDRY